MQTVLHLGGSQEIRWFEPRAKKKPSKKQPRKTCFFSQEKNVCFLYRMFGGGSCSFGQWREIHDHEVPVRRCCGLAEAVDELGGAGPGAQSEEAFDLALMQVSGACYRIAYVTACMLCVANCVSCVSAVSYVPVLFCASCVVRVMLFGFGCFVLMRF